MIPRRDLYRDPEVSSYRISYLGNYFTWMAPLEGVMNVWIQEADRLADPRPLTRKKGRGVAGYTMTRDEKWILYFADTDGDEDFHIFRVGLDAGEPVDLTPFPKTTARMQSLVDDKPHLLCLALNDRDPKWHDPCVLDINTGEIQRLVENEGFEHFSFDEDGQLDYATRRDPQGNTHYFDYRGNKLGKEILVVPFEDGDSTYIAAKKKGERLYYLQDSLEVDKSRLAAWNPETGEKSIVFEDPKAELGPLYFDKQTREPLMASTYYDKNTYFPLTPAMADELAFLEEQLTGEIYYGAETGDKTKVVILDHGPQTPLNYYLFDRKGQSLEFLACFEPWLRNHPLKPMQFLEIPSRDGLTLTCYLTLPEDCDLAAGDRPTEPLPLVLDVHGGPWARDGWYLNPYHQWNASRGRVVLNVNFRGSAGFGKEFLNAGNGEWGRKMQDDLDDAVDWCIAQGIADPDKVAIVGGSYGGYAALAGVTFTPERYACAVDIVGPSSIQTLLDTIPPYWESYRDTFYRRTADPRTPEGQAWMKERSPLHHVDKITTPLMILQGANDPRVKQSEADQIVEVLKAKGIPVTYVLYTDEGHGFHRPENRMAHIALEEIFLAKYLGGGVEPIGPADFEGSSAVLVEAGELKGDLPEEILSRLQDS
jgi:dipeptidyl aminopeptidase/acylaminoacyl peptidase